MSKYCELAQGHPFHGSYHDREYGYPVTDDNILFERLVLEINQAGLSWLTILKKRDVWLISTDRYMWGVICTGGGSLGTYNGRYKSNSKKTLP